MLCRSCRGIIWQSEVPNLSRLTPPLIFTEAQQRTSLVRIVCLQVLLTKKECIETKVARSIFLYFYLVTVYPKAASQYLACVSVFFSVFVYSSFGPSGSEQPPPFLPLTERSEMMFLFIFRPSLSLAILELGNRPLCGVQMKGGKPFEAFVPARGIIRGYIQLAG